MRLLYEPIPSGCAFAVIRVLPGPAVSFVIPEHRKVIRRYEGTRQGGDGRYAKHGIDVPSILYTFTPQHRTDATLGMYILKAISESEVKGKEVRIGNTYGGERICWGHVDGCIPNDLREKVHAFWEAPFNDDLTPYPTCMNSTEWEIKRATEDPAFAYRLNKRNRAIRRSDRRISHMSNIGTSPGEFVSAEVQRALIERMPALFDRIERTYMENSGEDSAFMEAAHPNQAVRRMIAKRRETYNTLLELSERKRRDRLNKIQREAALIQREVFDLQGVISDVVKIKGRDRRLAYAMFKTGVGRVADKIRTISPETAMRFVDIMYRFTAVLMARLNSDSFDTRQEYTKYVEEFRKSCRKEWWENGGWTKYGDTKDLTHKVFGSQFIYEEPFFSGVAYAKRSYDTDPLTMALDKYMSNRAIYSMYLPVWRLPDGSVFGFVGDVGYVGTLESGGKFVNLRLYNEKDEAIMSAAKEIFG